MRSWPLSGLTSSGCWAGYDQNKRNLRIIDLPDGAQRRLTFDADDVSLTWSPDRASIAFSSNRRGFYEIFAKQAAGAGDNQLLLLKVTDQGC